MISFFTLAGYFRDDFTIDLACNDTELNLTLSFPPSELYILHQLEYRCSEPNSNRTINSSINNEVLTLQTNYYVSINPQLSDGTECVVRGCYGDSDFSRIYLFESGCTTGKIVIGVCTTRD